MNTDLLPATFVDRPLPRANSLSARPILCGTERSPEAQLAADVAALIARRLGAPLVLVHSLAEAVGGEMPEELAPALKTVHEEAERLRLTGVEVTETAMVGLPDDGMAHFARNRDAALIVMGAPRFAAPARWLPGSVSDAVSESGNIPILIVRDAAPFAAWTRGERPLCVFIAADFTPASDAAIAWVEELRRVAPCEVHVGFVSHPTEDAARYGLDPQSLGAANPPELQELLERDLREKVRAMLDEDDIGIHVAAGGPDPAARLVELVQTVRADLLVIGTHQHHGFGRLWHSFTGRSLFLRAPMSVACVPPSGGPARPVVPKVRRVLAATDFSAAGDRAVGYACALLPQGGELCLVHIMPLEEWTSPPLDFIPPAQETHTSFPKRVEEFSARLHGLVPCEACGREVGTQVNGGEHTSLICHRQRNIPFHALLIEARVIEHDDPARAICQTAERFGADVIVLGTHGRTGFAAALMGSVAQGVLAREKRPVLLVRQP